MSALARSDFAPWSLSEAVVSDFVRKGAHVFAEPLDPAACAALLAEIRKARRFDESLFLGEAEYEAAQAAGGEPRRRRSLLERLEPEARFVERAPQVVEALWSLLGPDYRILERKIACQLPASALPGWVRRRGQGDPAASLSRFVRPELRDMAYARGADFHQDLFAGAERPADVVTLHVYLHPVARTDAPVHLLEGSHRLGVSAWPHDLKRTGANSWRYRDGRSGDLFVTERVLTGEAGLAALWHGCTLCGAPPEAAGEPRISLRYRIARGTAAGAGVDSANAAVAGPLTPLGAPAAPPETATGPRWNLGLRG